VTFGPKLIKAFSAKTFQPSSLYTVEKTENTAVCILAHKTLQAVLQHTIKILPSVL